MAQKDILRVITCGSVDDGKSTLIGRLLYDLGEVASDRLDALGKDSRRFGTCGDAPDLALLLDGLAAEREQGITIDVAYRAFETARRRFIMADAPGHEQYTRNMVTGASTADAAIILVNAQKGVLRQTFRHACLVQLLGVRTIILAVNQIDAVAGAEARFGEIVADFSAFAERAGIDGFKAIPTSGLRGDNVARRSEALGWHGGPTLIAALEAAPAAEGLGDAAFHMPVQWVNRPDAGFRGYCGTIVGGAVQPGDALVVQPSGREARVDRIVTMDGDLRYAAAGRSVTLTFAEPVDCSRGDVLSAADAPLEVADLFEAVLVWMGDEPLLPGRSYWLKLGATTVAASVTEIKYELDVETLDHLAAKTLELNAVGVAVVALDRALPFAPYADNRDLGGFILIDRISNATVGAGMIRFAPRRAHNISWQTLEVDRAAHAAIKRQQPKILWFTGLSGAGKTTIANLVEKKLHALGRHSFLLDGDNVRHGLNKDLGFTDADRVENIRRLGEVARLMTDAGLIVLVASISPFRAERAMVRTMAAEGEFAEIFVDTPLAHAEARDPKGLYAKARAGRLANFTGIDSAYEPPEGAEIVIDTTRMGPEAAADLIVERLFG